MSHSSDSEEDMEQIKPLNGSFISKKGSFISKLSRNNSSRHSKSSMDRTATKRTSIASGLGENIHPILIGPLGSLASEELKARRKNLHLLASENNALDIRQITSECDINEIKKAILETDEEGNTVPMVAALHNHKEALMALLAPFFSTPHDEDISSLVHAKNDKGQNLMALVVLHIETLFAAHGLLVEFEAASHNWNMYEVQKCLRAQLGSTQGAKATLDLLNQVQSQRCKSRPFCYEIGLFIRCMLQFFILRLGFYLGDVVSDLMLAFQYYKNFKEEKVDEGRLVFPGNVADPKDPCLKVAQVQNGDFLGYSVVQNFNGTVPLKCYAEAFTTHERMSWTFAFVALPWLLFTFELWYYRTFSVWFDQLKISKWLFYPFKLLGNLALFATWPLVAYFRTAFFQYQYEKSKTVKKALRKPAAILATTISTRASLLEVSTEASLQPLVQLYVVLINLILWKSDTKEEAKATLRSEFDFEELEKTLQKVVHQIFDAEMLRIFASSISIFMMAFSYTSHYRRNKDQILPLSATFVYFFYVLLSIIVRILCFEMFALYLGPGRFPYALLCVGLHVLLMSLMHYFFSDSPKEIKNAANRHKFLIVHNCLFNGLANIYVHNHVYFYKLSTRKTLLRQTLVDLIILAQNVAMIVVAKDTITSTTEFQHAYLVIVFVCLGCYLISMSLKILFYCFCHPWSTLIRPTKLLK